MSTTPRCLVAVTLLALGACSDQGTPPSASFATTPPTVATSLPATTVVDATTSTSPPDTTVVTTEATTTTAPPTTIPGPLGDPSVELVTLYDGWALDMAVRPGSDVRYLVSQAGEIIALNDDGSPVGDRPQVAELGGLIDFGGEKGLLGIAFHPSRPYAYVNYSDERGDTVIAQYSLNADHTFQLDSRRTVLTYAQPYANHNGGDLAFGPDGMLYIAMGDGGDGGDPDRRALNLSDPMGKMMRIDVTPDAGEPYVIPPDNPFVGVAGALPEIWSVGLRNPWRFSFDPLTGDMWIGDVGQGELEEISVAWADVNGLNAGRGTNFGWSAFEGTKRFNDDQPTDGHTPPIWEYTREKGDCSVSGGVVYRGTSIPELVGWYVYADYCSGSIRALQIVDRAVAKEVELARSASVTAIVADPDGELWVLTHGSGNARIVRRS